MWDSALLAPANKVTGALLRGSALPAGAKPFERVSAVLAVRKAVRCSAAPDTLLFMLPEATASLAKQITAGLLVGNHAHRNGHGALPSDEVRPLFDGDLLLVTSAVSECKGELENLAIGRTLRLRDVWQVLPFSKYTVSSAQKPRVFVANPGWILKGVSTGRFGAVVIDASHPRSHEYLSQVLHSTEELASLRFVIAPPMSEPACRACGYPDRTSILRVPENLTPTFPEILAH